MALVSVKCLCVLSRDLSPVVEIWIILSGMFRTLDKKSIKKKNSYFVGFAWNFIYGQIVNKQICVVPSRV